MCLTSSIDKVRKWNEKNVKFNMRREEAKNKKKEVNALLVQIFEADFELKQSMTAWKIINLSILKICSGYKENKKVLKSFKYKRTNKMPVHSHLLLE